MASTPDITLELAGTSQLEELLPLIAAYHAFEKVESSLEQRRSSVAKLLTDKSGLMYQAQEEFQPIKCYGPRGAQGQPLL